MPPTPRPILLLALVTSALVGLSAIFGLYTTITSEAWLAIGFEVVILVAGLFGVLTGLGKFRESHAFALACVAGAILVCSFLSFVAGDSEAVANAKVGLLLKAAPKDPLTGARIGAAALVGLLSGLVLLLRHPRVSFRYLALGIAFGAPAVAALGAALVPRVQNALGELHQVALAVLVFLSFFVLSALISISAHCLIRAFEVGRVDPLRETKSQSA